MGPKRIPLVAGNWKMNFDHLEATYFVQQLAWNLRAVHFDYKRCEIALMPSFTSLRSVQVAVESDNLKIRYGAQAVSVTSQGAFTGDVSADMIAHLGCSYVIVGHSERRKYHPEDDANIVDQVRAVLAAGMQPILCVGESYEERRKGIELDFAVGQVHDVTRDWLRLSRHRTRPGRSETTCPIRSEHGSAKRCESCTAVRCPRKTRWN